MKYTRDRQLFYYTRILKFLTEDLRDSRVAQKEVHSHSQAVHIRTEICFNPSLDHVLEEIFFIHFKVKGELQYIQLCPCSLSHWLYGKVTKEYFNCQMTIHLARHKPEGSRYHTT